MTDLTLDTLRQRAAAGDYFAREALRRYRTDAELQSACRLAESQDLSDGGVLVDAAGRPV